MRKFLEQGELPLHNPTFWRGPYENLESGCILSKVGVLEWYWDIRRKWHWNYVVNNNWRYFVYYKDNNKPTMGD